MPQPPQLVEWVCEDPSRPYRGDSTEQNDRSTHRPRRAHTKSRRGCQNCKKRRVKCDERKPKCSRCFDFQLNCNFLGIEYDFHEQGDTLLEDVHANLISQPSARTHVLSYLEEDALHCLAGPRESYDPLELLDHFILTKTPWIGSPECQRIMQKDALQLSLGAPYLLHAILAFSASNLSYLRPKEKKYSIAAASHYERSLNLYSLQLRTCLDKSNADAIYASCHLHSMLALRNVYLTSVEGSTGGIDGYSNGWLRAMQGTRVLRESITLKQEPDQSIWLPVRIEARASETYTCIHNEEDATNVTAYNTSIALHHICKVGPVGPVLGSPYQQPLSQLCQLMRCDIGHGAIGMFMVFIGKLQPCFIQLLDNNDPKAMLIMAHWCSLVGRIDQWWIKESAKLECARFCSHINMLSDHGIQDLLPSPI